MALPQLILGPCVALLLYQKWIDARVVFAVGLCLIALACFSGMQLTAEWNRDQFVLAQALHALGQPLAVVSLLFLSTSVVQPPEGPYVSGAINMLRAFGSLAGAALVSQLITVRSRFHLEMLLDQSALLNNSHPIAAASTQLSRALVQQSVVLAIDDAFLVLGLLAVLLIPLVLKLTYIPRRICGHLQPPHPHPGNSSWRFRTKPRSRASSRSSGCDRRHSLHQSSRVRRRDSID